MGEKIREAVGKALAAAGTPESIAFTVERPAEAAHGDYATNAAMVGAKALKRSPKELAIELVESLKKSFGDSAERIEIAGPGFINVTLSDATVRQATERAVEAGERWGHPYAHQSTEGTRVMVEYTDPNPFKEMHIGHLMSNVIGESLARLIANEGAEVSRANYQGDVGPHVAKAIWGLEQAGITEPATAKELGEAYAAGSRAYEEDPGAKEAIDKLNTAIYAGDDHALMELWRKGRDVSLTAFEDIYRVLGTKFDYYFFESETGPIGTRVVKDELARGVFEESEGAIIYRGEKAGLHTLVFITSRGTPTYEAKDIGLAFLKEERASCDRSVIVTAAEQTGHFKVMLAALREINETLAGKTTHVPHGFLRLTSGKMSSREGNVITAADFIQDVMARAAEKNDDPLIAEQVAVGAIKFMVLRQAPGADIIFDPERSLSLEGDSGPYLQYALVRAVKILAYESADAGGTEVPSAPYAIERVILHYPEVAARAAELLAPNVLVTYLLELASAWNSFYAAEQVLGSPEEEYKQRVTRAFAHTMSNGLRLLGIPTPERM